MGIAYYKSVGHSSVMRGTHTDVKTLNLGLVTRSTLARSPADAEFGDRRMSSSWLVKYEYTFTTEGKRRVKYC